MADLSIDQGGRFTLPKSNGEQFRREDLRGLPHRYAITAVDTDELLRDPPRAVRRVIPNKREPILLPRQV